MRDGFGFNRGYSNDDTGYKVRVVYLSGLLVNAGQF